MQRLARRPDVQRPVLRDADAALSGRRQRRRDATCTSGIRQLLGFFVFTAAPGTHLERRGTR